MWKDDDYYRAQELKYQQEEDDEEIAERAEDAERAENANTTWLAIEAARLQIYQDEQDAEAAAEEAERVAKDAGGREWKEKGNNGDQGGYIPDPSVRARHENTPYSKKMVLRGNSEESKQFYRVKAIIEDERGDMDENLESMLRADYIMMVSKVVRAMTSQRTAALKKGVFRPIYTVKLPEDRDVYTKLVRNIKFGRYDGKATVKTLLADVHKKHIENLITGKVRPARRFGNYESRNKREGTHQHQRPKAAKPTNHLVGGYEHVYDLDYLTHKINRLTKIKNGFKRLLHTANLGKDGTRLVLDHQRLESEYTNSIEMLKNEYGKGTISHCRMADHEITVEGFEITILYITPNTMIGGAEKFVKDCVKKNCETEHYHLKPKDKKPKPQFEGAKRRLASKTKLCVAVNTKQIVKCIEGPSCTILFNEERHFHIESAKEQGVESGEIEDTKTAKQIAYEESKLARNMSATERAREMDLDAFGFGNNFRGGVDRFVGFQQYQRDMIDEIMRKVSPNDLQGYNGIKCNSLKASDFEKEHTSSQGNQCFWSALCGSYENGQKLKRAVMNECTSEQRSRFSGNDLGSTELIPYVLSMCECPIIVVTESHSFVYLHPKRHLLLECIVIHHDNAGVGHFSRCKPSKSTDTLYGILMREYGSNPNARGVTARSKDDVDPNSGIPANIFTDGQNDFTLLDNVDIEITPVEHQPLPLSLKQVRKNSKELVADNIEREIEERYEASRSVTEDLAAKSLEVMGSKTNPLVEKMRSVLLDPGERKECGAVALTKQRGTPKTTVVEKVRDAGHEIKPSKDEEASRGVSAKPNEIKPQTCEDGDGAGDGLVRHTPCTSLPFTPTSVSSVVMQKGVLVDLHGYVRVRESDTMYQVYKYSDKLQKYIGWDSVLQCYDDKLLDESRFTIVADSTYTLATPSINALGHYDHGDKHTYVTSAFSLQKGVVDEARAHEWFAHFRVGLINVANTLTFDTWYKRNVLYRGLTKNRRDMIVCKEILGYLSRAKICMTIGDMQTKHLATPIFENFKGIPIELVLNTLVYFGEKRVEVQSMLNGTVAAQVSYLSKGHVYRGQYSEPIAADIFEETLMRKAEQGAVRFTSKWESLQAFVEKKTCILRDPYVRSSDSHGDASQPEYPAGNKFELLSSSKGCGFKDPYLYFKTRTGHSAEQYQSVGGCFGTRMKVIERSTLESERSMLRMTLARENEAEMRANQQHAFAFALARRAERDAEEYRAVIRRIRKADPKYQPLVVKPVLNPDNGQKLMDIVLQAFEESDTDIQYAPIQGTFFDRIKEYVEWLGVKKRPRYEAISLVENELNIMTRKSNRIATSMKPHEAQKYKKGKLKYGREVGSLTGEPWVKTNPIAYKEMKSQLEHPLVVENNTLKYRGREYPLGFEMKNCYFRGCLKDTELVDLASAWGQVTAWCANNVGSLCGMTHGDDQVYVENVDGVLLYSEGDNVSNDGSFSDSFFKANFHRQTFQGYDCTESIAQTCLPVETTNPLKPSEKITLRSKVGGFLSSGHGGTTCFNTEATLYGSLNSARLGDIVKGYEYIGFTTEVSVSRKRLEDVTFLSKCFARREDGSMFCFTELASLLRNFGRVTGDVIGRNKIPVCERWEEHVKGVVAGWVHEPESRLINELKRLCGYEEDYIAHMENTEVDEAYIDRYYPNDRSTGIEDYETLLAILRNEDSLYGVIVVSRFIDSMMAKRYGMEPVSK